MRLIRVQYGKKNTPPKMREYQKDGYGPVGTLDEFKKQFPGEKFEIFDPIDGKKPRERDEQGSYRIYGREEPVDDQ